MHRKRIIASLIVFVAAMTVAAPVFAIEPGQYASGAGTKLGRGMLNAATGWGEIPKQTVIESKENGVLGGVEGFFTGIALGVARTLAGAFEIATFWVPIPEGVEPVLQPATVFDMTTTSNASATPWTQTSSR